MFNVVDTLKSCAKTLWTRECEKFARFANCKTFN